MNSLFIFISQFSRSAPFHTPQCWSRPHLANKKVGDAHFQSRRYLEDVALHLTNQANNELIIARCSSRGNHPHCLKINVTKADNVAS
jgi:hypothetical protein